MDTFLAILNIVLLLLFVYCLFLLQKKHVSFSKRVFLALGIGIVFGVLMQLVYGKGSEIINTSIDWFNIVGNGYVKLLKMVVMPLVFTSILAAFIKLKLSKNIGKISGLILAVLLGTTAIAATVSIITTTAFDLEAIQIDKGDAETARAGQLEQTFSGIENMTLPQKALALLPENPFLDFTGARPTSTIAIVLFAAIVGVAYLGVKRKEPELAELFAKMIESIYAVVMRVVTFVLRLTPYGVLAIMARVTATSDYDAIWKLGKFVLASYVALLIMFVIHLLLLAINGLNPVTYVKKVLPVLTFAFTSRTSAGTLPLTVKAQTNQLGVSEGIANFAGSFGLSIGQNGCAGVYPAMLAVMIAPTAGVDPLTPSFILTLIAVVVISSFGVAGVGGGATFAAILVLSTMNLPVGLAGLLISVEPLIDMGRTALNVNDSMLAGVLTSKWTGELDTGVYGDPNPEIEA